ncbi:MAG: hypothetical protein GC206_14770 [Alphaproteobacteria bacterium]|nr:hypothetical protein [Alphaproteobacteria bacterium]
MKHFLLLYDFHPDFMTLRTPHRAMHLAHARAAAARGELVLGGALDANGPPMGALLFKAENPAVPEAFAAADPYVTQGVVSAWRVREWTTVVGPEALTPLP